MSVQEIGKWFWRHMRAILLGGLLFALLFGGLSLLKQEKNYQLRVSFVFPGAENGLYPDGRRLLRDDLISNNVIEKALADMQAKGWYTDMPLNKVRKNLHVQEHLSYPVQEKVQAFRAEGKQYSYYNNEYTVSFTQPIVLHLKDSTDFYGLNRPDRSKEFVEALLRAFLTEFEMEHTEGDIYAAFSEYMYVGDADYGDLVTIYNQRAQLCINALNKKVQEDRTFVSDATGLSFEELATGYQSLIDVQIERLRKYVSAEKLTRSLNDLINKLEERRDNELLYQKKKTDESAISKTAMEEYDHTFSENIIIVSVNGDNGLYQARPKTAYDTVTQRALNASVAASQAGNSADDNQRLIWEYTSAMGASGVQAKLDDAEEMVVSISSEYERLSKLAAATIAEFNDKRNDGYIKTAEIDNSPSTLKTIIKLVALICVSFGLSTLLCMMRTYHAYLAASRKEEK